MGFGALAAAARRRPRSVDAHADRERSVTSSAAREWPSGLAETTPRPRARLPRRRLSAAGMTIGSKGTTAAVDSLDEPARGRGDERHDRGRKRETAADSGKGGDGRLTRRPRGPRRVVARAVGGEAIARGG